MVFKYFFPFWITGGVVFIIDRLTKYAVEQKIPYGSIISVIPGCFNIVHVRNPGIAFSIFAENTSPLTQSFIIGITLIAITVLHIVIARNKVRSYFLLITYGLILGGALGNFFDRVMYGKVTDFFDIYLGSYHWPAFNIADSAITVGACLIAWDLAKNKSEDPSPNMHEKP